MISSKWEKYGEELSLVYPGMLLESYSLFEHVFLFYGIAQWSLVLVFSSSLEKKLLPWCSIPEYRYDSFFLSDFVLF